MSHSEPLSLVKVILLILIIPLLFCFSNVVLESIVPVKSFNTHSHFSLFIILPLGTS